MQERDSIALDSHIKCKYAAECNFALANGSDGSNVHLQKGASQMLLHDGNFLRCGALFAIMSVL